MRQSSSAKVIFGSIILVSIVAIAFLKRDALQGMLTGSGPSSPPKTTVPHASTPIEQVKLTPQAQANLHLTSKPLRLETFWKTIQMPGQIVDRPGFSDRGVVAPITGVVTKVHHFPGDTVGSGDVLFTLRLLSESMQLAQTELLKATREMQITQELKQKLETAAASGGIPQVRITELDNQLRRLAVSEQAYRLELQTRGLTPTQIDGIATGRFVTETQVKVPERRSPNNLVLPARDGEPKFEIQELKVDLGQQVQAGQMLCLLSHHESLYIEGRGFRKEVPLLEKTIEEGREVEIEFMEDESSDWPAVAGTFSIRHIANTVDPISRTFAFYVPLVNQSRTYEKDGQKMFLWRFRPGQRVRLDIRIEKLENVFVLPADALVHEGAESYVFRQNGDLFDRKPVRVLVQDRQHAVIANDGSVPPGIFVAQNSATQLNRVLKSQSASGQPNVHVHADGTVHANH